MGYVWAPVIFNPINGPGDKDGADAASSGRQALINGEMGEVA